MPDRSEIREDAERGLAQRHDEFAEYMPGHFLAQPVRLAAGRFELRSDGAGNFDELVGQADDVHLEMMSDGIIWMQFKAKGRPDDVTVVITAEKRGKLSIKVSCND